jgi:hypothetical protein
MGSSYAIAVKVYPISPTVTLKWENVLDSNDFVEDEITTYHERILYEPDMFVSLYLTGSADVSIIIRQTIG